MVSGRDRDVWESGSDSDRFHGDPSPGLSPSVPAVRGLRSLTFRRRICVPRPRRDGGAPEHGLRATDGTPPIPPLDCDGSAASESPAPGRMPVGSGGAAARRFDTI